MIEKHGGVEDFVVDPFGFKYQVRRHFAPIGHVDEDDGKHGICILGFIFFNCVCFLMVENHATIEIDQRGLLFMLLHMLCLKSLAMYSIK